MSRAEQLKQLELLSRIFGREMHVFEYEPDVLTSHLCNTIFLDEGQSDTASYLLTEAREILSDRPWLRLCNRPLVSRSMLIGALKHGETVWALSWSPDGSLLASAGADGAVRLWNPTSRRLLDVLKAQAGGVNALAWSPDGQLLASGHDDATVRLWNMETFQERTVIKSHTEGVLALAWSPDGSLLASAGADGVAGLWELATKRRRFVLKEHTGMVYALAWSPDGSLLASGGEDATVRLWDSGTGEQRVVLEDSALREHLQETTSSTGATKFLSTVFALAWSEWGLASGSRANVELWEPDAGKPSHREHFSAGVASVAWQPRGSLLAIGVGEGQVWLWHPSLAKRLPLPFGHTADVRALAWSPDGELLATGSRDNSIRLWEAKKFWDEASQAQAAPEGHSCLLGGVSSVAWGWDGSRLVSGGIDNAVRLWSATTGAPEVAAEELHGPVLALASHGDGVLFVPFSTEETFVVMWASPSQRPKALLQMETVPTCAVAPSPDGRLVAVGDIGGNVWVWKMETRELIVVFLNPRMKEKRDDTKPEPDPVWALAWSPDSSLLASAGSETTVIWNLSTKKEQVVLQNSCAKTSRRPLVDGALQISLDKRALAWSPDGSLLALDGAKGAICLLQVETGQQTTMEGHSRRVCALAWSPDGLLLASGDWEGAVRLWNHQSGDCVAAAWCLSSIMALQFGQDSCVLRAADDGAATLNRPLPYVFELCNIEAKIFSATSGGEIPEVKSVPSTTITCKCEHKNPANNRWCDRCGRELSKSIY